jgi:hypothetical protein
VLHDQLGRRFSPLGLPVGEAFPLVSRTGLKGGASVHVTDLAMDDSGRFVVVSQVQGGDAFDEGDILVRRFAANGLAIGREHVANTFRPLRQDRASAAMAADGRSIVVWDSADIAGPATPGQDGSGAGVYGQRFRSP